jgi:hypothetical protein
MQQGHALSDLLREPVYKPMVGVGAIGLPVDEPNGLPLIVVFADLSQVLIELYVFSPLLFTRPKRKNLEISLLLLAQ